MCNSSAPYHKLIIDKSDFYLFLFFCFVVFFVSFLCVIGPPLETSHFMRERDLSLPLSLSLLDEFRFFEDAKGEKVLFECVQFKPRSVATAFRARDRPAVLSKNLTTELTHRSLAGILITTTIRLKGGNGAAQPGCLIPSRLKGSGSSTEGKEGEE